MQTKFLMLLILSLTTAVFSEDFKTINGKKYKAVTVTRVEPDGIVVKTNSESQRFTSPNCQKTFGNSFITTSGKPRHILPSRPQITQHIKSNRRRHNVNNRTLEQRTMRHWRATSRHNRTQAYANPLQRASETGRCLATPDRRGETTGTRVPAG